MNRILFAIRKSKYYKLIRGTIFACLAIPFLIWGSFIILQNKGAYLEIVIPLAGILTCVLSGLYSMLHKDNTAKAAL